MTVEAVFFDLDDTLYSYPPCREAGKDAAFRRAGDLGYEFDRDAFDRLYREGRRSVKRDLDGTAASHERFLYFKQGLERYRARSESEMGFESIYADALALGRAFWEAYVDEMTPYPGVEETLATLRDRDVDVAIVTNLTTRIQLVKLDALGLEPYVDLLLTSEEAGREKPGSVMFTLPLARLDRRASEALMVGDNVDADVAGANAVGLETVLFDPRGEHEGTDFEGRRTPDHRIMAFEDLVEVLP